MPVSRVAVWNESFPCRFGVPIHPIGFATAAANPFTRKDSAFAGDGVDRVEGVWRGELSSVRFGQHVEQTALIAIGGVFLIAMIVSWGLECWFKRDPRSAARARLASILCGFGFLLTVLVWDWVARRSADAVAAAFLP